jgi:DNA polymerase
MAAINYEEQLESVRNGEGVNGSPMDVIPSLLRGAFRAPEGFQFVAADLSQIELRVLAWITGSTPMMHVFENGLDPYIDFAAAWFNVAYEAVTKEQRQIAKPAVLSCGYGSGGGKLLYDADGNEVKTGLWGYAHNMGIQMTLPQAWEAVNAYRATYSEVVDFWNDSMAQIIGLLEAGNQNPKKTVSVYWNRLLFKLWPGKMLRVMLPSGRWLTYLKPKYDGFEVTYDGKYQGNILRRRLYGSLFTENIVQAIARDVMAVGMVRAYDAGFKLVGHTHDEIIALAPVNSEYTIERLNDLMTQPIEWCADLPLKSDGWEGPVYKK